MGKIPGNGKGVSYPPYVTCQLCKYRLTDICVEDCAPARDYRHFKLKDDLVFEDYPRFPLKLFLEELSPKVRQVVAAIYLAKIMDYLQGVPDGHNPHGSRSREALKSIEIEGLLARGDAEDSSYQDREECSD
jgi:hypothetical protein